MESEGKERWSWGGIVRGRERGEGGERRRVKGWKRVRGNGLRVGNWEWGELVNLYSL
jgi:hypothetical protein